MGVVIAVVAALFIGGGVFATANGLVEPNVDPIVPDGVDNN